jgi:hypothetical protein
MVNWAVPLRAADVMNGDGAFISDNMDKDHKPGEANK